MKAFVKNYQQSPRKVRLVTDFVRGDGVLVAVDKLRFLNKKAAPVIMKAIESAVSNAKQKGINIEDKKIMILVNEGRTLNRIRPRAKGSAYPIRKRASHIKISLV